MKRVVLFSIVLLVATVGIAWAGKAVYKLVMSKDKELCMSMLNLFNDDMKKYSDIRYDKHEIFSQVPWKVVDLGGDGHGCIFLKNATFDINNDGKEDLVLKTSMCLRDQLSDSLYIFSPDSDVISKLKLGTGGFEPLRSTPNKFARTGHAYDLKDLDPAKNEGRPAAIAGVFTLQPFMLNKAVYVSMTDLSSKWMVIAKYLQGEEFQDICYFRRPLPQ